MNLRALALTLALGALGAGVGPGVAAAAPASASAPRQPRVRVGQVEDAVAKAARDVGQAERARATLAEERATLDARYAAQLAEIDKLKRQKASWRRDRALRAKLAESVETAQALASLARRLAAADADVARARTRGVAAIDAALPAATGARRTDLLARRARWAPAPRVKRIVIPDDVLDPLADPEELDQQAAALADSEHELAREIERLESQARRFDRQAALRKQHARADELALRDDADPRPGVAGGGARSSFDDGAPTGPQEDGPPAEDVAVGDPALDRDAAALAAVIDPTTVDVLRSAGRTNDPARRAVASRAARDAVAARLARLRQQRAAIEARARDLRRVP